MFSLRGLLSREMPVKRNSELLPAKSLLVPLRLACSHSIRSARCWESAPRTCTNIRGGEVPPAGAGAWEREDGGPRFGSLTFPFFLATAFRAPKRKDLYLRR